MAEQSQAAGTEWVDIVNENNEVIAQSSRQQMRAQSLRHRATYIVVHDGMGKILVQRRTKIKDFYRAGWMRPQVVWCKAVSKCWNPHVVKRKKNLVLLACRSQNMAYSIMKAKIAGVGRAV